VPQGAQQGWGLEEVGAPPLQQQQLLVLKDGGEDLAEDLQERHTHTHTHTHTVTHGHTHTQSHTHGHTHTVTHTRSHTQYLLSLHLDRGPVRLQRHTHQVLVQGVVGPTRCPQRRGFNTVSLRERPLHHPDPEGEPAVEQQNRVCSPEQEVLLQQ